MATTSPSCRLCYLRLQPRSHTVAVTITYGRSLRHTRSQPPLLTVAGGGARGEALPLLRPQHLLPRLRRSAGRPTLSAYHRALHRACITWCISSCYTVHCTVRYIVHYTVRYTVRYTMRYTVHDMVRLHGQVYWRTNYLLTTYTARSTGGLTTY